MYQLFNDGKPLTAEDDVIGVARSIIADSSTERHRFSWLLGLMSAAKWINHSQYSVAVQYLREHISSWPSETTLQYASPSERVLPFTRTLVIAPFGYADELHISAFIKIIEDGESVESLSFYESLRGDNWAQRMADAISTSLPGLKKLILPSVYFPRRTTERQSHVQRDRFKALLESPTAQRLEHLDVSKAKLSYWHLDGLQQLPKMQNLRILRLRAGSRPYARGHDFINQYRNIIEWVE